MRIEWGKKKEGETSPKPPGEAPGSATEASQTPGRGVRRAAAPVSEAPRTLAQLLMQEGNISPGQMKEALAIQEKDGGFLGQILIDMGCFDENSLTSFLAKQCKIPHLSLLDYLIEGDMFQYIPKEVCAELRVLPIDKLGKNLTVGMVNPLDVKAREKIRELCPDLRIKPILCSYSHYKKVMEKFLGITDSGGGSAREMSLADYGFTSSAGSEKKEDPPAPVEEPVAVEPVTEGPVAVEPVEEAPRPEPVDEPAPPEDIPAAEPEPDPSEPVVDGNEILGEIMSDDAEDEDVEAPSIVEVEALEPTDAMEQMLSVMRESMRDTYAVLARRMALFRGLSSEEVAKIFASGMTAEHDAGDTIFEKGDKSDELHVVLSGKVEVVDEGRPVALIEPGGLLGEMAWISDEPRSASAVAVEPTSLITLSDDVFENLVSKEASIQLLMNIILTLTERLRLANEST